MFSFGSLVGSGQVEVGCGQFSYVEAGKLGCVVFRCVTLRLVQFWQVSWGKVS